ncbi:PREDICTED: LRR receptor-like serine/threonine-protein kinase ERL1 isoform X2 [Nelumbo nucifera]|uniref:non-specific serine/threonine protein kinase n=1 Tax=Nelumbo nucifera TaxID=4432 RepID=A0A1U8BC99_NELNU|nr:PREDICTED: LRR receptor-like serine/threonine-protein kinase ERL1 isoform X2 [Nelumbo nucifera]
MEKRSLSHKGENLILSIALVTLSLLLQVASPLSDEGNALMSIKASFSNVANVLLDWDDARNEDYCSWRGVSCDNVTFSVVSLNLSNLNLGGEISPAIGDLRNLQATDLKGNRLIGQIPDEIGNCVSLKTLDLSDNSFYGDIPFSLSKLKQLEDLTLKNNQLTGPIPSTLSQLPNLKTLDLAHNQLTGEIPRLIYWNEVLQYLGLRGNSLTGALSPDMCQLTGLWFFDVRGNNLTGKIPDSIGNCTSFEVLDISYNQITGEIPYNIGFLQVATLSLQGNKLTGRIPEVIGLMQALAVLDLSENELVGPIPPILGNLSYTGKLYLHGNKLTGPIPPELGNMSKLSYLQLNNNELVGGIPAELGKLGGLFELNLANNNLEGPIPQNISFCTALNQFNVHGNRLSGPIPSGFRNLGSLTYLNLSSNNFKGKIPVQLGRIINLDTLDLSSNDFSGPVPALIGDLEHLLTLDMSFNKLSGRIPEELGQLQNIVSLILNNNNLHGEIPTQLINCFSLVEMNVSFNNLSGDIPAIKNFTRFPPESFLGNPLLCRNWLGSSCGPYAQESKAIFSRAAIVCITMGCLTLLSMALVVIYRSSQQRDFIKESNKMVQGPPKLVILHTDMALHTYEDIMRITEDLSEKYIIGYGASSTVYKCVLKNSKSIAIKRLYNQYPHNLREFETELETIGSIKHRNLVTLHGYSLSPHGNLLFYDYMENGSLWGLLHGPSKKVKLDWDTRLKIAVGAAQGLAYLHHDCNPRVIHRDVKSSNILLDENFDAHLSDFGIAKCISSAKTHSSTFVMGTIGYIDPEYARTSRLNEKSDVYSFGIVLLELLTGKKAVDNESNLHQLILSKADDNTVMEVVDPEVSVTCMDMGLVRKTFQLALLCTKRNPSERPTMHEVARVLVSLLPPPPSKSCTLSPKLINYAQFVVNKEGKQHHHQQQGQQDNCSSDAQWFMKFGEVISKTTLL